MNITAVTPARMAINPDEGSTLAFAKAQAQNARSAARGHDRRLARSRDIVGRVGPRRDRRAYVPLDRLRLRSYWAVFNICSGSLRISSRESHLSLAEDEALRQRFTAFSMMDASRARYG